MEKPRSALRATAILVPLLTAACTGGGAPGPSQPAATSSTATSSTATSTSITPVTPHNSYFDTLIAGTIAVPAAATYSSATAQVAMPGGPAFDGSSGAYPANVTFPLLTTSLQAKPTGLLAAAADHSATITVSTSANSTSFQLAIPSQNLNFAYSSNENLVHNLDGWTSGLSYVAMGEWGNLGWGPGSGGGPLGSGGGPSQGVTESVFGYETPTSAMPTTGTATFSGTAVGSAYKTIGTDIQQSTQLYGKSAFSADFASGKINGSFTNMQYWDGLPYSKPDYLPWNDVSVTANIATGTNRFSGSTAAASAPASVMSLSGSAMGRIDGAFYGPAAQNLGAVWSLNDGSASAIGTVVAGH